MRSKLSKIALPILAFTAFFLSCTDSSPLEFQGNQSASSSSVVESFSSSSVEPSSSSSAESSNSSSSSVEPSSSSEVLCNGQIFTASEFCYNNNEVRTKCDGQTYTAEQFCGLDNNVYTLCGGFQYNTSTQFCLSGGIRTDKCNGLTYESWQFCYNGSIESKCDGSEYDISTQKCQNNVIETKCGNDWYNSLIQFCYSSNKVGNFCGINPQKSYDPDLYECKSNSNGIYLKNGITDTRDSKKYNAVLMGTQIWMAENLNYTPPTGNSWCYENCTTYGMLYDWATAMANSASSVENPSGIRGVCPSGWHLPSHAEWVVLMKFVNPNYSATIECANAGKLLKATKGWDVSASNSTDDYGFSALPGGIYWFHIPSLDLIGAQGNWWSASEYYSDYAYSWLMLFLKDSAMFNDYDKPMGLSVRCVKD